MRAALEAHNQRAARGASRPMTATVFNYTGDGMCAVFASPRSAVDAAVAAQRGAGAAGADGASRPARPSCAATTTSAPCSTAPRGVMAAGHGGQILLDGATAGLLSGVDLTGVGARGGCADIAKPVDVFQVQADGPAHRLPTVEDASIRHRETCAHRRRASSAARSELAEGWRPR